MLNHNFKESEEKQVKIYLFSPETVQEFLAWHYASQLEKLETNWTGFEKSEKLLQIAHYYDCQELLESCQTSFKNNMSKEIVVLAWMTAKDLGLKELVKATEDYMVMSGKTVEALPNIDQVLKSPDRAKDLLKVMSAKVNKISTQLEESKRHARAKSAQVWQQHIHFQIIDST